MSRRVKRHYDEAFKLQVLSEYYSSGKSKDFIARKYDLGDSSSINQWE
jgi:transposase-like protein